MSKYPLTFGGFFLDENISKDRSEMGICAYQGKTSIITLNQLYLLNKFGHKNYLINSPQLGKYYCLTITFDKMMKTRSHELTHYFQYFYYQKSSCESDYGTNKYIAWLAQEH